MKCIGVVGGGLVGLATALKLKFELPETHVVLFEKESDFGQHQSTHNSGVLHAGLYYKPGSAKAKLAVQGIREMTHFCRDHRVPHEICGKVVVAVNEAEVPALKELFARGQDNGLAGLRWLSPAEVKEREPYAAGVAAVLVPQEGIVDYREVVRAMVAANREAGNELMANAEVRSIRPVSDAWVIEHALGAQEVDFLVNCGGLQCDLIGAMAGEKRDTRIVPFRGEYYKLRTSRRHLVNHLIYPVPDAKFPFLGVHFTRLIEGGVEAGPNAILAMAREGYRKNDVRFGELLDALTYPGLWRFMLKHGPMCWAEVRRSFSKELFCASLQRLVPEIQMDDLTPGGTGVRAQALSRDGTLVQDFALIERNNALHVLNAPSPAATASLAIGGEIARRVAGKM